MTLGIYLRTLISTWLLAAALPFCLPNLWLMVCWLFSLSIYAVLIVVRAIIELDHIDHRLLPSEPASLDDEPVELPRFDLVGASDKRRGARQ